MCGVAGIFSLSGAPVANAAARIARMTAMLDHRGPDGSGYKVTDDGLLALGTTRLAVTDPGAPVGLPLSSESGSDLLSFNGEIYDYQAVRAQLEGRGVRFRYRTDTEVLLEALRVFGEQVLERLDGMWAFAHYNKASRRLLLSRDVMGERHLFYRRIGGELLFSSEPGPILADRAMPEDVDLEALAVAMRYYAPPPGLTLVKGLRRLLPGHNIAATPDGQMREYRYRRLQPEKWHDFFAAKPTTDRMLAAFDEIMQQVTEVRLPPDSPYIATLSGGIDSALICAYASRQGTQRIPTLYAQSSDEIPGGAGELNERDASRYTAAKLGTDHIEIRINNGDCVPALLATAKTAYDGMLDPGVASFRMLAAEVRKRGRKVLIVSDGPDEIAGGYRGDADAYRWDRMERDERLKFLLLRSVSRNPIARRVLSRTIGKRAMFPADRGTSPFHFAPHHTVNTAAVLARIAPPDWATTASGYGHEDAAYGAVGHGLDATQRRALSYAAYSLPDMCNLRTDKAFFAESVEARVPFQAPAIVDFLLAIPAEARFDTAMGTKALLRQAVDRNIGSPIARRGKYGFSAQLFDTPSVYSALRIQETVASTPLFRDLPFAPGAREFVLAQENHKLRWIFFALAHTWEQLRRGEYDAGPRTSTPPPAHAAVAL